MTGFLGINNNNFPPQDLSIFSRFVNLEKLFVHNSNQEKINQGIYNRFVGSLESLKDLSKLNELSISNTDIDSGLEYLSESIKYFYCLADKRTDAKCKTIYNLFANERGVVETKEATYGNIKYITNFPQKLQEVKQKIEL